MAKEREEGGHGGDVRVAAVEAVFFGIFIPQTCCQYELKRQRSIT